MMRTLPLITDWGQGILREPYLHGIAEDILRDSIRPQREGDMADGQKIREYVLALRNKKARKLGLAPSDVPIFVRASLWEILTQHGIECQTCPTSRDLLIIPLTPQQILDKLKSREQINPDEILLRTRDGFTKVEVHNSALGAPFIMGASMERPSTLSELRTQSHILDYTRIRTRRFDLTDEIVDGRRVYAEL